MKIGFIGFGNMASSIVKGFINSGISKNDLYAYDISDTALKNAEKEYGINICANETEIAEKAEIIFLAIKPNVIRAVLEKIDDYLKKSEPLIVSIAAGKTIEYIEGCLKNKCRLIRVMPNINAKVSEAVSAFCSNKYATEEDKKNIQNLLSRFGKSLEIDESHFPVFGVIGGCAPAYAYMFIDALARAGVKNGLTKNDALMIAAQTVYGSAKMILESKDHPWKLVDNVCSPGGTTIEGVLSLQSDGFESAVHNAVQKSLDKDKKL